MKSIHVVQHVEYEGLANIKNCIDSNKYQVATTEIWKEEQCPDLSTFESLIILGGPMSIYEENSYDWLTHEKKFIEKSILANKTILGICLGAQLIAEVLGAKVYKGQYKEIGWHKVYRKNNNEKIFKTLPEEFYAFHWHGDTFDIPEGATLLASSAACQNQAFSYKDKVLALQFHLEMNKSSVKNLIDNSNENYKGKYIQTPEVMLSKNDYFERNKKYLEKLL